MAKPDVITSFAGENVEKFRQTYGYLPSEETGGQMLDRLGMDATKWCAEMVGRGVVKAEDDGKPGSWFHGWMCNAIMKAYDIGFAKGAHRSMGDLEERIALVEACKDAYIHLLEPGNNRDVRHILRPAIKKADSTWPPIAKTEH